MSQLVHSTPQSRSRASFRVKSVLKPEGTLSLVLSSPPAPIHVNAFTYVCVLRVHPVPKGVGFLGIGITDSCEPPNVGPEN